MKPTTATTNTTPKSSLSKSMKKSAKSRSKSTKIDSIKSNEQSPTTPTTSQSSSEPATTPSSAVSESSAKEKTNNRNYAVFDTRTIKVIWEQHDTSDTDLAADLPERLAEDVSYKVWELINNIKTYARHSGGKVTCDIVNEVLKDGDVPPILGAMEIDWDRIDYDGDYFFQSDKIVELRDEYQKDIAITIASGPEIFCSWPVEANQKEFFDTFIPSMLYGAIYGDNDSRREALEVAAFSPQMGSCYRAVLEDLIQYLAFKQTDKVNERCWRVLQALAFNPYTRDSHSREEYFNLAEVLICQLMAPYETIKVQKIKIEKEEAMQPLSPEQHEVKIKIEIKEEPVAELLEEIKEELIDEEMLSSAECSTADKIYKLQMHDDGDEEEKHIPGVPEFSPFFASPVDSEYVNLLCETIGKLAAQNGFFQSECLFLILRRLEKFFEGRLIGTERDYHYISRSIRGLTALGDYAFREFIPYIYKFQVDNMPESLWTDFTLTATFLKGRDDIFLYEWLENLCGDKLQPFMTYYAHFHQDLITKLYRERSTSTFKIFAKTGVRRLEIRTRIDEDTTKEVKNTKPSLADLFPEKQALISTCKDDVKIRFKFSGCRPALSKQQKSSQVEDVENVGTTIEEDQILETQRKYVLVATRKLYKPLSNERSIVPLSSFYFLRI